MRKVFSHRLRRHLSWRRRCFYAVLIMLCVVGLLLSAFFGCRPILTTFAESQAVWLATQTANRTSAEVLEQYQAICRDVVTVIYTDTQRISAVQVDTAAVNTVRNAMTAAAMSAMESFVRMEVSLPVGTLLGIGWLSGWGPLVTFPMSVTATVLSEVSSSLVTAGINQSSYRVLIHLDIQLYVVSPGSRSTVGARVSYPMAETVLLGEVPDNLTEVYGDDQSLLGKIFDYGTMQ